MEIDLAWKTHVMVIEVIRGDLTEQDTDVIVNAANSALLGGGGVDGAIHRRGGPDILAACRELRREQLPAGLPTGQAVATTAGRLAARWVVHTVGPVYSRSEDRSALLASSYAEALRVATGLAARSIAFPAISSGAYGWPIEDAARVAVSTVASSSTAVELVRFVLFSDVALGAFAHALDVVRQQTPGRFEAGPDRR